MIMADVVLSGLQVALLLQGYIQWPMANPGESTCSCTRACLLEMLSEVLTCVAERKSCLTCASVACSFQSSLEGVRERDRCEGF